MLSNLLLKSLSLEELDVSWNQIEAKSMFCLSEALQYNRGLRFISFEGNPIGNVGIRFLMNAQNRNLESSFEVNIKNAQGETDSAADNQIALFDPENPEGQYVLDLTKTYD